MPPTLENATKVELIYDQAGLEAVNVLWFEALSTPDVADVQALANNVQADWNDEIMPLLFSSVTLSEVRATWYSGGVATIEVSATGVPTSGGVVADDPAPPQVALVVQWRGAVGGRQNRGRTFLPGIPNNVIGDNGRLTAGGLAAFQSAATDFVTSTGLYTEFDFVVYSRPFDGDPLADPPKPARAGHFTPITSAVVNARVDTQRRRLDG